MSLSLGMKNAYTRAMKQVTVTLPETLEHKLEAYLENNPSNPDDVMQRALEAFLEREMQAMLVLRRNRRKQSKHIQSASYYLGANDPRAILQLPKEQRQARLQQQAEHAQPLYALGSSLTEWTEEFVEDEDDADIV